MAGPVGKERVKQSQRTAAPRGHAIAASLSAVALVSFGACASLVPPPTIEIVGVQLVSLGLTSGTVALTLDLTNEGSRKMKILKVLYDLEVRGSDPGGAWERLAVGTHSEEIEVPGEGTRRVTLPVPFEYRALGAALGSFLARGEIPYRLNGKVSLKGLGLALDVPFRSEGVVKP
jgi:LEA14-like dessication related protein